MTNTPDALLPLRLRAFRSSRADSGAQVLPPARATIPPSLRESSSRVSSLLVCYALGPPRGPVLLPP
jgi:hypothetical protein